MSQSREKTYKLRENPKQTERGRNRSRTRHTLGNTGTPETTDIDSRDNSTNREENEQMTTVTGTDITRTDTMDRGDMSKEHTNITNKEDQTTMIFQLLQRLQENIIEQNEKTRSELQNTMTNQNQEILIQLNSQKEDILEIRSEVSNIRTQMQQEIQEQIKLIHKQTQDDIDEKLKRMTLKQDTKYTQLLETHIHETNDRCDDRTQKINEEINTLQKHHRETRNELTNLKENTETQFTNLNHDLRNIRENINETNRKFQDIQGETDNIRKQMEKFKDETRGTINIGGTRELIVTCTGNELLEGKIKFTGKERNPLEFLDKLKTYLQKLEKRKGRDNVDFKDILENTLEDQAGRWWQIVKGEVNNLQEFEEAMREKYWNADIQRGIKRRIEMERYRPGGRYTRTEHFIYKVISLKNMTPTMDEEEIVDLLCEHYDRRIQDARRVQNINTIRGFERLLTKEDVDEQNLNLRHQMINQNSNARTPNHNESAPPRRNYNTRDMEQYNQTSNSQQGRTNQRNYRYPDVHQSRSNYNQDRKGWNPNYRTPQQTNTQTTNTTNPHFQSPQGNWGAPKPLQQHNQNH